jgi:hypothetical protein
LVGDEVEARVNEADDEPTFSFAAFSSLTCEGSATHSVPKPLPDPSSTSPSAFAAARKAEKDEKRPGEDFFNSAATAVRRARR